MPSFGKEIRRCTAAWSREMVAAVLGLAGIVAIGAALYGPSGGPTTRRPVPEYFHFACYPEYGSGETTTVTFSAKEWFARKRRIQQMSDHNRKFGTRGQVMLAECEGQWAYPAVKCPNDGAIFRHVLTAQEEARSIRASDLVCPKCGWSPAFAMRQRLATPSAGDAARRTPRMRTRPTKPPAPPTPRRTSHLLDHIRIRPLPTAVPTRVVPDI